MSFIRNRDAIAVHSDFWMLKKYLKSKNYKLLDLSSLKDKPHQLTTAVQH